MCYVLGIFTTTRKLKQLLIGSVNIGQLLYRKCKYWSAALNIGQLLYRKCKYWTAAL